MSWRDEQRIASDLIVRDMRDNYGIKEVTGKTHLKNGTRMFETQWGDTFGVYSSGMVRKVIRTRGGQLTCYQLNKTYYRKDKWTVLKDGELKMIECEYKARAPIYNEEARLIYLLQYLKKNYYLEKVVKVEDIDVIYDLVESKDHVRDTLVVDGVMYVKV